MTGGVEEEALTTKETFLEDWRGLPPRTCLATSAEEVIEEEEIKACAAIFGCVIFAAGYCGEKQPNLTTGGGKLRPPSVLCGAK